MEKKGSFLRESRDDCTLTLKVIPRSSRDQIVGEEQGALKIKVQAPPVEGAANDAVVDLLAEWVQRPKKSLSVISGHQSRHKVVRILGIKASEVLKRLKL